jgi:ubiquinone/menaquinone biosynthesis C-methylase UbiE
MASEHEHKETVRLEFTRQADAYAATPSIADPDRIGRLINLIDPASDWRALEVATGPGHVARALALRCREVIGIDLTDAPIEIARRLADEHGLHNVSFQIGDVERLDFRDGEFDLAVCRFALHHFEDPRVALKEMRRVVRPGGLVAVEDLIASEHPVRAAYHNKIEKLRDPSHTRALALSRLIALCARAGIEVERFYGATLTPDAESWMATTQTPPRIAGRVRAMLERDVAEDLSGLLPFERDGRLFFTQRTAAIVGRKLRA